MAKQKVPENIEWLVSGRVTYSGAVCTVHAPTREEAIRKANAGNHIGGVDLDGAEIADWDFKIAQPNIDPE